MALSTIRKFQDLIKLQWCVGDIANIMLWRSECVVIMLILEENNLQFVAIEACRLTPAIPTFYEFALFSLEINQFIHNSSIP